jgi:hypothetical protein
MFGWLIGDRSPRPRLLLYRYSQRTFCVAVPYLVFRSKPILVR